MSTKPQKRRPVPPAPPVVVIELSRAQVRRIGAALAGLKRNRRGAPGWVTLERRGGGLALEFVFGYLTTSTGGRS